ncbi:hypothetical protein Tco_1467982 [Tanacetum coccineum]
MGDVGSSRCNQSSLLDGITIAKINILTEEGKAGLRSRSKHTCMDDVAITSVALPKSMDGIACDTSGEGFKFGKSCSSKGILNNPVGPPLFSFHFGRNENSNPFSKKSQLNSYKPWNSGKINGFGPSLFYKNSASNSWADKSKVMNVDCSINIDSFAQKIKKKDIKAGSVACSLQLYGYFVDTFMDYMFNNEEGMKSILESGPWMVNNIPLVFNVWEPSIWLEKVELISIPIWLTKERCLNKSGKLDFARVLMEVSSKEELHHTLVITYPAMGDKPARVGRVAVKYQWQPPLCTHCKTFGHSTSVCKSRPRFEEEMAFVSQDGKKVNNGKSYSNKDDNEGLMGIRLSLEALRMVTVNHGFKSKVNSSSIKNVKQDNKPSQSHNGSFNKGVRNSDSRFISNLEKMGNKKKDKASVAAIEDEYSNVTEPQLMQEVIDVMKSGVYPSPEIRTSWSLSQVSFFYNNCHKYGLDPSFEDDDKASKEACMADEMRPENIIVKGQGKSNDIDKVIEQLVSNSAACAIGTGIIVGWDPNSVRVMVLNQSSQLMNVLIETVNGHHSFFCTFVYAQGTIVGRRTLWKDLVIHSRVVNDSPWVLLRDFNCILDPYERSAGSSAIIHGMADFRECLAKIEVSDLVMLGLKYTWNKSLGNPNGLLKKLDKERIQTAMVNDSHNVDLRFEEVVYLNAYKEAIKDEEIMLKQRAKVTWLSEDLDGNGFSGDQVGAQFVKYFQGIFGESSHVSPIIDPASLFSTSLSLEEANFMVRHVSKLEIKYAVFGIEDDKAPGPDGFSAKFFKAAWPIIGDELKKGSAKVKWEDVCQLKVHGGLGLVIIGKIWNRSGMFNGEDSHNHLFFECGFSLRIWIHFKDMVRLENAPNSFHQIILYLYNKPINRLRNMANGFKRCSVGPVGDNFVFLKWICLMFLISFLKMFPKHDLGMFVFVLSILGLVH